MKRESIDDTVQQIIHTSIRSVGSAINDIEKQIQELENETSDESKKQNLIAKSKVEALESKHYEKI